MLKRIVSVQPHETAALLWSFVYFFCLLCGYYILRPVRDEMGIQGGVQNLPWLFTATFVAMLAVTPLFGWLAARFPRRTMLPAIYWFFIANLLLFFAASHAEGPTPHIARAFFVWVSVFNLFVVSVFWSFMVDLFSAEQGKRLFGFIAAGGTGGAIAGPLLAAGLAPALGPVNLLWVSAGFLAAAVLCIRRLSAWAGAISRHAAAGQAEKALGGSAWAGIREVLRSPYLLGICFYLFCYTTLSTLLYLEMARLVSVEFPLPAERTRLFATLDLAVNVLTLAIQVFLTARCLRRFGVTVTLALAPAAAVIGFAVLGFVPVLVVLIVFGVIRRAGEFALGKPAREILFTVVSREEKYKAKNVIDTVVYRGGDALSSWLVAAARGSGLGLSALSFAAVPLAAAWWLTAIWLGRRQRKLELRDTPLPSRSPADQAASG
ncbi:MAG: NTP/NDP exchange transporter [Burkholderiales bacterium]